MRELISARDCAADIPGTNFVLSASDASELPNLVFEDSEFDGHLSEGKGFADGVLVIRARTWGLSPLSFTAHLVLS